MSFKVVLIIVAVVAAVPLLIVAGLLLAGMRANRGVNRAEIVIHAPAAEVWRHLEDPALVKGWVGGLVALESLTRSTAAEVGARDRMIVEVNGQRTELFSEITAVERGRRIAQTVRAEQGLPFTEDMSFTLEAEGPHTRFIVDAKWHYTTWTGRLLEPIIDKMAQKKIEGDLARLKANVERT